VEGIGSLARRDIVGEMRTTAQEKMGLSTGFPVLLMAGSARANGL